MLRVASGVEQVLTNPRAPEAQNSIVCRAFWWKLNFYLGANFFIFAHILHGANFVTGICNDEKRFFGEG